MLDKRRAKTWVKVVAWGLAISFGISFTFLAVLPGPRSAPGPAPGRAPRNLTPVKESSPEVRAAGLMGQGELAMEKEDFDQAIGFFEQAREIIKDDPEVTGNLSQAYFEKGENLKSKNSTDAVEAFKKYLDLAPEGDKIDEVKKAIEELK